MFPFVSRMTEISISRPGKEALPQRHGWRGVIMLLVLVAIALGAWTARKPLLRELAALWIVSDPITHADAIVVLGGDFQMRPWVAAQLYRRGVADKILISQVIDRP